MFGKIMLTLMGAAGILFGVLALRDGHVRWQWVRFGAWGSLSSEFDRDEQPVAFWLTTLFYLLAGACLLLFGVARLLGLAP